MTRARLDVFLLLLVNGVREALNTSIALTPENFYQKINSSSALDVDSTSVFVYPHGMREHQTLKGGTMRLILSCILSLLLCLPAVAAYNGPGSQSAPATGGFQGPSSTGTVTTAAQALKAPDDTRCVLEGHIIASGPKHEKYIFQDATGKITVEIDDELFAGRTVTPQHTVRLYGEVDTDFLSSAEVDVHRLDILQ